jgi:hypothetical protein
MSPRKDRPVSRKSSKESREQHEEFQKRRDAMHAAVNKAWNFPNPAAADELAEEAVAKAHSMDAKKGGEVRRKNRLTAPHEDEALELLIKTWERFVTDAENEGLVPKQIKTRTVRVR